MSVKTNQSPSDAASRSGGEVPAILSGYQAAVSVAAIAGILAPAPYALKGIRLKAVVAGSSGATTAQVKVDGVVRASVTVDNADPDGTVKTGGYSGAGSILATVHTGNTAAVAKIETVNVAGNADGDYTVTINSHDYTYTAASKSAAQIRTALLALVAASPEPVTGAASTGATFTLTANVAGVNFTLAVTAPSTGLTIAHTQANVVAVDEVVYVQIVAVDAVTYVVTIDGVVAGSYAATSADTVGTIRDGLIAQVNATTLGTAAIQASDTLAISAPTVGTAITVVASCVGDLPIPVDAVVSLHISAAATGATGIAAAALLVRDFS